VVLDNCEHVLDGAAELASAVAEGCSGARVLATSREALGTAEEQLIPVPPLDPAGPGAELFIERARAVSSTFDPHAHRGEIEEICRRVDGLPLAIELAAARTRTLTPPELVQRLGNRLRLLTAGRRTSAERHRTLRATMAWSYDLLTSRQQVLLQRLSLFAGPFDLDAAEHVAGDEELGSADVDDLLQDLVERSMLAVGSGPSGRRFRLLETVREFAAEQLGSDPSSDVVAERHARWCVGQVARIHELLVGPGEIQGVARLGQLWPDLRTAFDRAVRVGDRELAGALIRPVATEVNLRRQTEICEWAERILAITPRTDADPIVYWLACATYRYMQVGDHAGYEALVHRYGPPEHALIRFSRAYFHDDGEQLMDCSPEAVAWLRQQGEEHAAALTEIAGVGGGLLSTGQFEELDGFVSALAERYRAQGPPTLRYVTLSMLGYSASFQGRVDRADQLFEEAALVDVPDRTISVNAPVEARAAFRHGQRFRAFRILRAHVVDLLDAGYTDNVRLAAAEFVTMMAAMDRLPDAAPVLGYLSRVGDLGTRAIRAVVPDAATIPDPDPDGGSFDARLALECMRGVLGELAEDQPCTD
jgi:predicted ATPase